MADSKISALADGSPAGLTDEVVVARGGANKKLSLSALAALFADAVYPVGSVFTAVVSTNPATLLGIGTWNAMGSGKVLIGVDAADTDFNTVEKTGGAKTSVSTGNVSAPAFTGSLVTSTSVSAGTPTGNVSAPTLTMNAYTPTGNCSVPVFNGNALTPHNHSVTATGTNSIPVFTGNNLPVHNHAVTAAGTNSIPVFTGSALTAHQHELPMQIISATLSRVLNNSVFGTGTSRTSAANVTSVANAVSAAVALTQNLSAGTPAGTINAAVFTGSAVASADSNALTPAGTINAPAFTGSAVASANANAITPTGVINAPAFTGTANTLTGTVGTPSFTGTALGTHNHNVVANGNVAAPTYTGDAQSIVPPYITVFFWKRTA